MEDRWVVVEVVLVRVSMVLFSLFRVVVVVGLFCLSRVLLVW